MFVYAVDRPDVAPFEMSDRFRHDVTYFMTPAGEDGVPELAAGEYWIRLPEARTWLDELAIFVISPLDSSSKAEVELTEEQEAWLCWMVENQVQHIRLVR